MRLRVFLFKFSSFIYESLIFLIELLLIFNNGQLFSVTFFFKNLFFAKFLFSSIPLYIIIFLLLFKDFWLFVLFSLLQLIFGFVFEKMLFFDWDDTLYKLLLLLFFCIGEKEVKFVFIKLLLFLDILFE